MYFNFAKMLLLDLEEIRGGTLEMSICLLLPGFRVFASFLLNWENIHCLKVIFLSLVVSLSQSDLWIVLINFQTAKPNSVI